MTSTYNIITIANLESIGIDYSQYGYSDANIEEWISLAEIYVCSELKTTFNSTAANEIKIAVKEIARQIATNLMITHKKIEDQSIVDPYNQPIVQSIIKNYTPTLTNGYSNTSVVKIRMDGYNKNE
jgi:hypothetical protein